MADPSQSKKLQFLSKIGLILVAVALILSLVGGWLASTQSVSAIDQSKLDNYQKSLQSYAAEALLLTRQYKSNRSTASFAEVSFQKLFEASSDVANKLQQEKPEAGLDQKVKQTSDEAKDLAGALAQLSQLPGPGNIDDLVSQITEIRQQLQESISS